jgi:integrase
MGVIVRQKTKGKGKSWWVFVAHQGKRTSRQVGDKEAAEKVASKIRAQLRLDEFNFEGRQVVPTFKAYAKTFLESYSAMNHKSSTQDAYESAINNHLNPYFGDVLINEVKRRHVKEFLSQKQTVAPIDKDGKEKDILKSESVRRLKAYLSCIFSQAVDDELIETNPVSGTGKLIKKTDKTKNIEPLNWEEKTLLEDSIKTHFPRYYPFFLTALRTGMRLGELIALKPGDLDFNGSFIEVKRSVVRNIEGSPKSGKIRRVDMSADLKSVLTQYLTFRKKETLEKGWKALPEWLFYNEAGSLIDVSHLRKRVFYKALKKAGLRQIRIHDLRHTYATLRIRAGHNIADVSKQLGHHSISITVDTYYHWMPGSGKSEVDQLDLNSAPDCTPVAPDIKKAVNDVNANG